MGVLVRVLLCCCMYQTSFSCSPPNTMNKAPEVINRKPYDQKVDMWSIGVTTYLLLCGDTPFNGKNRQQLFRRISCDEPTFADDKWGNISDQGVQFVRDLLTKDPAKRLSATQALSHLWLMEDKEVTAMAQPLRSSLTSQRSQTSQHSQPKTQPQAPLEQPSLDRRTHGSSRGPSLVGSVPSVRSKTPSGSSGASHRPHETARSVNHSLSREPPKRSTNNSMSRERTYGAESESFGDKDSKTTKSGERRSSKSKSRKSRSGSRDRSVVSHRGAPPPPLKANARDSSAIASEIMKDSSSVDVNARLLAVIKNQDAKIEQLERLVKRMLEPEGALD
jgi:serine/threonine protein kinase